MGGGAGRRSGWGVRVDVNEEVKLLRKLKTIGGGGGGVGSGVRFGGQDGCERRS